MNKRGQVFMMILVVVTLIGLSLIFMAMISKFEGFDKAIGERQFEIWNAHAKAQSAQFYIDLSAQLAADQSVKALAARGGLRETACGEYFGYPLWMSKDQDCTPTKPADAYTQVFDDTLNELLVLYPDIYLPTSNYEYSLTGSTLVAKARSPIVIPIVYRVEKDALTGAAKTPIAITTKDVTTSPTQPTYATVERSAAIVGDYAWPSKYTVVTSCKGGRDVKEGSTNHLGIDIRARTGDPVFAAADGTVLAVEPKLGGIRLQHANGLETRYLHNSQILVQKGDGVQKGQMIARAGAVATSIAHIHFEAKKDGNIIDPIENLYKISENNLAFSKSANCVYNKASYTYASLITPERVIA
jgi:murein DD-endopeptidase MepM/ murein hydrolase activator NlpD